MPSLPNLRRTAWLWPLLYVAAFFSLRLFLSPNLGTDDVEAAVFAQGWAAGYNPKQPPLYTWALLSLYRVFGVSMLAHAVLKYALLLAAFLGLARCMRILAKDENIIALSPLLLPLLFPVGWGAQEGFTHTILLMAALFWCLAAFLNFSASPTLPHAAELGLALGVGMMSKYNFAISPMALALAALTLPGFRRRVFHPRTLIAAGIAILIFLPHGLWLFANHPHVPGVVAPAAAPIAAALAGRLSALGSLGANSLLFLCPLLPLGLLLAPRMFTAPLPPSGENPHFHLLLRTTAFALLALIIGIAIGAIPEVKARYLHPVLLPALPLILMRAENLKSAPRNLRLFKIAGMAAIAVFGLGLLIQGLFEPRWCKNCRWHAPMPGLATAVRASGFSGGSIIAADEHLAGNMRLRFPEAEIWTPPYASSLPFPARKPCLGLRRTGADGGAPHEATLPLLRFPQRNQSFQWIMEDECGEALLSWVMAGRKPQAPAAAATAIPPEPSAP